jgi:hypothetical protein
MPRKRVVVSPLKKPLNRLLLLSSICCCCCCKVSHVASSASFRHFTPGLWTHTNTPTIAHETVSVSQNTLGSCWIFSRVWGLWAYRQTEYPALATLCLSACLSMFVPLYLIVISLLSSVWYLKIKIAQVVKLPSYNGQHNKIPQATTTRFPHLLFPLFLLFFFAVDVNVGGKISPTHRRLTNNNNKKWNLTNKCCVSVREK